MSHREVSCIEICKIAHSVAEAVVGASLDNLSKLLETIANDILESIEEQMYLEELSKSMEESLFLAAKTFSHSCADVLLEANRAVVRHSFDHIIELCDTAVSALCKNIESVVECTDAPIYPEGIPICQNDDIKEIESDFSSLKQMDSRSWQHGFMEKLEKWKQKKPVYWAVSVYIIFQLLIPTAFSGICCAGCSTQNDEHLDTDKPEAAFTISISGDNDVQISGEPPFSFEIAIHGDRELEVKGYVDVEAEHTNSSCPVSFSDVSASDIFQNSMHP